MIKSHILFTILYLTLYTISYSQSDTLSTTSYEELREIIEKTLAQKDTARTLSLIDYHRARAQRENNPEQIAFGYGRYGYIIDTGGDLEKGFTNLNKAIETAREHHLKDLELRALISKGYVYNDNDNYPKSIEAYYTAMHLAQEIEEYETYHSLIIRIGWIKSNLEDNIGAIEIFQNGLKQLYKFDTPFNEEYGGKVYLLKYI